jgi:hypothetical protein
MVPLLSAVGGYVLAYQMPDVRQRDLGEPQMDRMPGEFFHEVWWMDVRRLPLKWRRLFVILFPITGPLWVIALIAQAALAIVAMPICMLIFLVGWPVVWCVELWKD